MKQEKCVCGHAISRHRKTYSDAFEDFLYFDCNVKGCDCAEFGDVE